MSNNVKENIDKFIGYIVYLNKKGEHVPLVLYESTEDGYPYVLSKNKSCVYPEELTDFIQTVEDAVSY
jgi:hypothetical protein